MEGFIITALFASIFIISRKGDLHTVVISNKGGTSNDQRNYRLHYPDPGYLGDYAGISERRLGRRQDSLDGRDCASAFARPDPVVFPGPQKVKAADRRQSIICQKTLDGAVCLWAGLGTSFIFSVASTFPF